MNKERRSYKGIVERLDVVTNSLIESFAEVRTDMFKVSHEDPERD